MSKWILLIMFALPAFAGEHDDAKMRAAWVRELKSLLSQIEKTGPAMLVESDRKLLQKFSLIDSAWADSRYNCFYGGWPSVLRNSGGKKVCQLPANTNAQYDKGACRASEIQCQPQLFSKGLCVSFSTPEERRSSFANCEKKFQAKGGSYEFLNNPTREESEQLKEISLVAADVCGAASQSPQKNTSICKSIMKKLPDGLKSIEKGFTRAVASTDEKTKVAEAADAGTGSAKIFVPKKEEPITIHNEEDCDEPSHSHKAVVEMTRDLQSIAKSSTDALYEEMKKKFQDSPFCDPLNVMNNPASRPSGMLIQLLNRDVRGVEFDSDEMDKMLERYEVSGTARDEIRSYASRIRANDKDSKTLRSRLKGVLIQDVLSNRTLDMSKFREEIRGQLEKKNVFKSNSNGESSCPFVSKDAFMKAMAGRDAVLTKYPGTKADQITIVDYSQPSNARRMYVLDLNSMEVLHNTWVAHGIGSDRSGEGNDGLGGSPDVSNVSGSLKSSDGFILAGKASYGEKFKNNVLLNGIDSNNTNLAARSVIVHGWASPMEDYSNGVRQFNPATQTYSGPAVDPVNLVKRMNFKSANAKEMDDAIWDLVESTHVPSYLPPTEGCLGVPKVNMKHLDKKGRNMSQLEMLRQDLPGSIIFNYSGPDMKSKYF